MRSERLGEGVPAGGDAVSGNHLPNPLPPRVRRHSSTAQTPAKRVRRSREHARGDTVWQCRLRSTSSLREQGTALGDQRVGRRRRSHAGATESRHRALRTEEQHPGAPRRSNAGKRRRGGVQLFTGAGRPRGVRHIRHPGRQYTHRPDTAIRPGPAVPLAACRIPAPPARPRARTGAVAASGSCAGQTTDSDLRNRIFSANFSPLTIPWGIGRSTPLPPGKKRPGGTLPPDGDGPRMRGALPCTASE